MEHVIVSLYDEKTEVFGKCVLVVNEKEANRLFVDLKRGMKTLVGQHPEDFKLYKIGVFNDLSGLIISEPMPRLIVQSGYFKEELS